jgi:hypothetical protein
MKYHVNNNRVIEIPPEECWDELMNLIEEVREDYLQSMKGSIRPGKRVRNKLAHMRDMIHYMCVHSNVARDLHSDNAELSIQTQHYVENTFKTRTGKNQVLGDK